MKYVSKLRRYNDLSYKRGFQLHAMTDKRKDFVVEKMEVFEKRKPVRDKRKK